MQALDHLNSKLNLLLRKYAALEAENKRLRDTVATQLVLEGEMKHRIATLEQGMVSVNLGGTVTNADERDNMKRQLDGLISEIDGILNTLND